MKLCKDCKHFVGERRSPVSLCGKNPLKGQILDPVYGDTQLESAYATRVSEDWCGMEAKWFERRPLPMQALQDKVDLAWEQTAREIQRS